MTKGKNLLPIFRYYIKEHFLFPDITVGAHFPFLLKFSAKSDPPDEKLRFERFQLKMHHLWVSENVHFIKLTMNLPEFLTKRVRYRSRTPNVYTNRCGDRD